MATFLILSMLLSAIQLPYSWKAVASSMYVYIPWLLAHWEEYHTGMMVYGNGFWGVTEANYAVVFIHFFTFMVGPGFWFQRPLAPVAALLGKYTPVPALVVKFLTNLPANEIFSITFFFFGLGLTLEQMLRVFRLSGTKVLLATTLPRKDRGHKNLGKGAAVSHLLQLGAMFSLGTWMLLPQGPGIGGEVRVRMVTFGLVYGVQATRLIVAHMAKEPFTVAVWPLVVMAAQIANTSFLVFEPVTFAYGVCAVTLVGYLHYVVSIIRQISQYLGIRALTIKRAD